MSRAAAKAHYDAEIGETVNYITAADAKAAIDNIYDDKLDVAGGTITGFIAVDGALGNPTLSSHLTTKGYVDGRLALIPGAGGEVVEIDHGTLTGLDGDDHPHYHNDARGDLRYEALGAVATHAAALDPHPVYLTAAEAPQPASTTPVVTDGTAAAVGTGTTYARNDHRHSVTFGTPIALGGANSAGTASSIARSDHVHVYPTAANVGAAAASHSHVEGDLPATLATDTEVATAVSNHAAAADPHTGYQKETERAVANGYASLDATVKVPIAQIPTGTTSVTVSLGNHTHAVDHGTTTGLGDDDHTQYPYIVVSGTAPGSPRVGTMWVTP
jgi:hypothetical protein